MKYFKAALIFSLFVTQIVSASSHCTTIKRTKGAGEIQMRVLNAKLASLKVFRHSSIDSLSHFEQKTYLLAFLKDVCKIKPEHLALTQKRGVRFYITNGPIIVHPEMAKLHERNEKPRNHSFSQWIDLPGAYQPTTKHVIINIASLEAGHGAKNLVLHEYGHALDYVAKNGILGSKKLSSTRDFKRAVRNTPWLELYRIAEHNDPELYANKDNFSEEAADQWRQSTLAYNQSIDESSQGPIEYAKANREEQFAELYAMKYNSAESSAKLTELLPSAANYFSELSEGSSNRSRRSSRSARRAERRAEREARSTEQTTEVETESENKPSGLSRFFRRVEETVGDIL